ncbi:hypothetical protein [Massilia niastensis]|uniref:hypothetical protein n=1 Tax=Massilia niastensis TaxID=544911 RepID=UPI0012EC51F9|nr:hypothetical protein [Massilia niastensis]
MPRKHLFTLPMTAALLALALAAPAQAQNNPLGATAACGPDQGATDGHSPQTVVKALYEIVSGPAGAKKDWERMYRLFAPGALVTATTHGAGGFLAAPQTPRQFADLNDRLLGHRGFFESEVAQQVHGFGHIAHVYSSYETRDRPDGPVRVRGVNSLQLLHDGARWCVLSITWDAETAAHPIPAALDRAKP